MRRQQTYWTINERSVLRGLWSRGASDEDIGYAIPSHSIGACLVKAGAMGLGRRPGRGLAGGRQTRKCYPSEIELTSVDSISVGHDALLDRLRRHHPEGGVRAP